MRRDRRSPSRAGATDIAVVGVGCRFPGGVDDLDSLWRVLDEGRDVTGRVPPGRPGAASLETVGVGGFLPDIDLFDAEFFGVSPHEAREMDPQQRLLLTLAWRAMEHSGVPLPAWAGSNTGVYFGILAMDYAVLHARTLGVDHVGSHYASGKEFSFGSGRVAYTFGLNGPCMTLTAACASSLLAVHLAARALAAGDCDTALAGGVNLMVGPELTLYMRRIQALSPQGLCRPFDADADGVVRGEGGAVVVLKRYADAVADGDRIWGVIKGSATNHDGRSAGLTAPNAVAQEQLLRDALRDADVSAADIEYVEAHSTGTPLGDPIELSALAAVFGPERAPERPLLVGSHKANFGHLDSAAGILGLLKALLVARAGVVPPQIKLAQPTPRFGWSGSGLVVPTTRTALRPDPHRLTGVSAFGLSGSNVHVVLAAPGEQRAALPSAPVAWPVLVLSGPSEPALADQVTRHAHLLDDPATAEPDQFGDLLFSAAARRSHHTHRLAVTGANAADLRAALTGHQHGERSARTVSGELLHDGPAYVVQVFSGQGSQYPGMGLDLYRADPTMRATLDECDALTRRIAGWSLLEELGRRTGSRLSDTRFAQPAIFAIQIGLSRLWARWGVPPDTVVGHSMGEVAAACAAGALPLEDALRVIVLRGELLQPASGSGRMAALALSADEVTAAVERYAEVAIAAVNGPRSVVVAGPAAAVDRLLADLSAAGVRCVPLAGDYAFHSPAVAAYGDELARRLDGLTPAEPRVPMLSSVDPAGVAEFGPAYWGRNVREPVLFWPAVDRLLSRRPAVFLELGPHPVLTGPLSAALVARSRRGTAIGSLVRGQPPVETLTRALAEAYTAGVAVDWAAVHGDARRYLPLPPVRLTGERYWLPTPEPDAAPSPEAVRMGSAGTAPAVDAGLALGELRAEVRLIAPDGTVVQTLTGAGVPTIAASNGDGGGGGEAVGAGRGSGAAANGAGTGSAGGTAANGTTVTADNGPTASEPDAAGVGVGGGGGGIGGRDATNGSGTRARTPVERDRIAALVNDAAAEALGYEPGRRLARGRGFFELGMDSLALVALVSRLERELGTVLGAAVGIEHPTIDALTDHLVAEAIPAGWPPAAEPEPAIAPARPVEPPRPVESPPLASGATGSVASVAPGPAEPIAIVGIGCRLPRADGPEQFWRLLSDGVDATGDVPADRWDAEALLGVGPGAPGTVVTRRGGFLDRVDLFDNAFFRISAREARAMDPQQRLFLEVAWEALEDAGVTLEHRRSARVGVFVGMNTTDYQQLLTRRARDVDLYYGTGNSFSGTAGRLSYFLDVRGPSLAIDTACSSSLVAVHLAVQSLRAGEADVALAGGVNVMVRPTVHLAMSAAGALSPDGRCKTFDASADGYGRGEGAGVVVLKTLAQAERDGDRVYAVIRGSAVNHNGASGGLTVPGGEAQEELIRTALAAGGVAASDVDYLEAHGTGTVLGDAVELRAIARALGDGRQPDRPLLVGSVKTNLGHLEAAAGIAGLIKTALALRHGELPAHLHVTHPTPQVDWARLPLRVTTSTTAWPATGGRPPVAGVSAFGFTGTNAHVVLSGPAAPAAQNGHLTSDVAPSSRAGAIRSGRAHLLVLSAAGDAALAAARQSFAHALSTRAGAEIGDICHAAAARRTHLEHRLAVVGRGIVDLAAGLSGGGGGVHQGAASAGAERLVLLYGDGVPVDWRALDRDEPAFRDTVDALDDGGAVRTALAAGDAERGGPAAVLAVQLGLTAVWEAHGLRPDAVVGRGVGELAAACAAGVLDPAQAIRAALAGTTVTTATPAEPSTAPVLWLASVGGPVSGPHPVPVRSAASGWDALAAPLAAAGERVLLAVDAGPDAAAVATGREPNLLAVGADLSRPEGFLDVIAQLHVVGVDIDWERLFGRRPYRAVLPRYPWQRRRHWPDTPDPAAGSTSVAERSASAGAAPAGPAGPADPRGTAPTGAAANVASSYGAAANVASSAGAAAGNVASSTDGAMRGASATEDGASVRPEATAGGPVGVALPDDVRDRCAARTFSVRWRRVVPPAPEAAGRWLVVPLSDASAEAGQRVLDGLRLAGVEVTCRPPTAGSDRDDDRGGTPTDGPRGSDLPPWADVPSDHGIVLVAAAAPGSVSGDVLVARVLRAARQLRAGLDVPPGRLRVVTAGAYQPTGAGEVDPAQAAVWAAGRVLAMEAAPGWGGLVDVDPHLLGTTPRHTGDGPGHASDGPNQAGGPGHASDGSAQGDTGWTAGDAAALAGALTATRASGTGPAEDELCLRDGVWYAARLSAADPLPTALPEIDCDPDAWYLVTDALHPASRPFVDVLVRRGLRRLIVGQSTPLDATPLDAAQLGSPSSGATPSDPTSSDTASSGDDRLAELAAAGVQVRRIDLTSAGRRATGRSATGHTATGHTATDRMATGRTATDRTVADLAADLTPAALGAPLGGVLIVGMPAPAAPLDTLDEAAVSSAMGWAEVVHRLDLATRGLAPPLFCVTGAAAAVWGAAGMAARAAAEGAVDAVSTARERAGLPVQVVRFMPVDDPAELSRRDRMVMVDSGLRPLAGAEVGEAFEVALRAGLTRVTVADVDAPRYVRVCRERADRAFLAEVGVESVPGDGRPGEAGPAVAPLAAVVLALPTEQRAERLLEAVLDAVAEVLGEASGVDVLPHQGFFDLGMDSVMSLSLRGWLERALGVDLPATLTFEFPNAAALTDHLLTLLDPPVAPAPSGAATSPATTAPAPATDVLDGAGDDLAAMSEDELIARLSAALAEGG
ncbi:beta-ketoacyl synthase N-terminal-like domain-containing protein [Micromonospora sp. bgisy143]|uniref:type I polyketide synthase n=1 Tax=Micromonospora sp. bgisy143 TaxID=3413790 RepID=UPI003EC070FB